MVFTPHGTIVDWGFPAREALKLFQRVALKCSRRILFISKPAQRSLSRKTARPSTLLTNAIDLEDYTRDDQATKPPADTEITFLYLGRLEEVKGVDTLIEAFSLLVKKFPGACLMIAGEGTRKAHITDLILKQRTNRIRYMGWMDSRKALRQSDVFVLPSREKGQPMALLEAMAAGKIIITSLPFIKPGRTGLYCRPGDSDDLVSRMLQVCRNPARYKKLGIHAREEVRSLAWDTTVKLFESEYEKALKSM